MAVSALLSSISGIFSIFLSLIPLPLESPTNFTKHSLLSYKEEETLTLWLVLKSPNLLDVCLFSQSLWLEYL
jgi:hypothetical protein